MDDTNCTVYINGVVARGTIGYVNEHGHSVEVSAKDYYDITGKSVQGMYKTVNIPGVPSYMIAVDDSVTVIKHVPPGCDMDIHDFQTIEIPVSLWRWRNINAICPNCNSQNYKPVHESAYICDDCGKLYRGSDLVFNEPTAGNEIVLQKQKMKTAIDKITATLPDGYAVNDVEYLEAQKYNASVLIISTPHNHQLRYTLSEDMVCDIDLFYEQICRQIISAAEDKHNNVRLSDTLGDYPDKDTK